MRKYLIKFLPTFFFMVLHCISVNAQTNVSGFISVNTTWNLAGSPYIVIGNVLVSNGFTLTIDPGVIVKFNTDKALQIDGEFLAIGTEQNRITFTSNQAFPVRGDWAKIHFPDTCADAVLDSSGSYLSGSTMQFCDVLFGGGLGYGAIDIESSSPYFNQCRIINSGADGIYCNHSFYSIIQSSIGYCSGYGLSFFNAQIYNCNMIIADDSVQYNQQGGLYFNNGLGCSATIERCYFSANSQKGAIYSGLNVYARLIIVENNFINNQNNSSVLTVNLENGGLIARNNFINNVSGAAITTIDGCHDTIECNNFLQNQSSLGAINLFAPYGVSSCGTIIRKNIFDGNTSAGGVSVASIECNSYYSPLYFINNTIKNNSSSNGICCKFEPSLDVNNQLLHIEKNNFLNNTAAKILYLTGPNIQNSSNNFLDFKNNNFSNPSAQYEFYNDIPYGSPNISAVGNYWGSISTMHVDSVIYDYFDFANQSVVYYSPILSSAVVIDTSCSSITIGISGIENSYFTPIIYPNPATSHVTIAFDRMINNCVVEIFNVLGESVLQENVCHTSKMEINLQSISNGIYLIKLFDGEKYYCKKIIVYHD